MARGIVMLPVLCILALASPGVSGQCGDLYNAMIDANNAMLDAQSNYQACVDTTCGNPDSACVSPSCGERPRDCVEIQTLGYTTSAIYTVYYLEGNVWAPVRVYCDMEAASGGWLVFQRRQDGTEDFYRNWADYSSGFGELSTEFWLGNYHLHMLTSRGEYKLRFDLQDFDNVTRYAEYSSFSVGDPSGKFILSVAGYSGDAGDAFTGHNGHKFSTKDMDHDTYPGGQCAVSYKGAWWYSKCHSSNLNGLYLNGSHASYADGVEWDPWRGQHYSLKFTEMKIKPV